MSELSDTRDHVSSLQKRYRANNLMMKFLDMSKDLTMISTKTNTVFLWVSKSWFDYLGWTFEELTENPFTYFIHPDDIDVSMAIFKRFQKTGKLGYTGTYTNRYLAKDGSYKKVEWQ